MITTNHACNMLHILHFKHYLFFFPPQSFQGVRAFPILRFPHMRQPVPLRIGAFFWTEISISVTCLSPRSWDEWLGPGCIFVIAVGALGRVWVWMVCCICLASNPALVVYESVLSGSASDYILLSPVLRFFFRSLLFSLLFFYIRCCSRAFSRYPVDYLPGWRNPINELRIFT